MTQETAEATTLFFAEECEGPVEGEYVPDVFCPNERCRRIIQIPNNTYLWDEHELGCPHCFCTFKITMGDIQQGGLGAFPTKDAFFVRPGQIAEGGKLLEGPTLIREYSMVPDTMTEGIGENVPASIRDAFQSAIQSLNDGDPGVAAVRCRYTLESVLADRGIRRNNSLRDMAEQAEKQGLITEVDKNICLVIASRGGAGAHPQANPSRQVTRGEGLTLIGLTSGFLRVFYTVNTP